MPDRYRVGSLFLVRLAGVPEDLLDVLRTPEVLEAARAAAAADAELDAAVIALSNAMKGNATLEDATQIRTLSRRHLPLPPASQPRPFDAAIEHYHRALALAQERVAGEAKIREEAIVAVQARLVAVAGTQLTELAPFVGPGLYSALQYDPSSVRSARTRLVTLSQYLQRIAAKNDTLSAFGPTSWGVIDENTRGFSIAPAPGITGRTVYYERWVCEALGRALGIEPPVLDTHGFDVLVRDVEAWPDHAEKARWGPVVAALVDAKRRFAGASGEGRLALVDEVITLLRAAGIEPPALTRTLYAATNVFGESCVRETNAVLGGDIHEQLAVDAAPWYDLWQDVHAYVSTEVARKLLAVVDLSQPVPLPEYLARCRAAGFDLLTDALPRLAAQAFADVQAAWSQWLASNAPDASRRTLTADELGYVRRMFPAPRVRDFAHPSIDVQLVATGDTLEVLVAELHGAVALLGYGVSWGCPDPEAWGASIRRGSGDVPIAYLGQVGTFLSCQTAIQFARFLPDRFNAITDRRGAPEWRRIPPAEAFVHACEGPDIRIRSASGEDLGTVTRTWASSMGSHPFTFPWAPHSPRLYAGRVIVQRETWTVDVAELPKGRPPTLQIDALRAAKGWSRFVFLRPAPGTLRRAGNTNRDKDAKPSLVDLESATGIEVLHKRLHKYGQLEISEMLPTPEQSAWVEGDGPRSFELRMMIEPA
jgi:hypothetical protein